MKFYVLKLTLKPIDESTKENNVVVVSMYKADRVEHHKSKRKLVFKNDKDYSDFQVIYNTIEVLDDGVIRASLLDGLTKYIASSSDTPNKALAKIHAQILREYGNTHPMAHVIPNALRRLAKPFSVMAIDKDAVHVIAYIYNEGQEKGIVLSTRKLRKDNPTKPHRIQ